VLINKLQHSVKKQLFRRHILTAFVSCTLLFICGLLSEPASALQQASKIVFDQQDPTRPPNMSASQTALGTAVEPKYELTAIFTRNNQKYAVVNGNIVKTGDLVLDMLVSDISRNKLTMELAQLSHGIARDTSQDMMVLELKGAVSVKTQVTK
jgi:hypothetical protein